MYVTHYDLQARWCVDLLEAPCGARSLPEDRSCNVRAEFVTGEQGWHLIQLEDMSVPQEWSSVCVWLCLYAHQGLSFLVPISVTPWQKPFLQQSNVVYWCCCQRRGFLMSRMDIVWIGQDSLHLLLCLFFQLLPPPHPIPAILFCHMSRVFTASRIFSVSSSFIFIILCLIYPLSLLYTWPKHLGLASPTLPPNCSTWTCPCDILISAAVRSGHTQNLQNCHLQLCLLSFLMPRSKPYIIGALTTIF